MTARAAFREAQRRWGKAAAVEEGRGHLTGKKLVGRIELGLFFAVQGMGQTWEEAFTAADQRSAR